MNEIKDTDMTKKRPAQDYSPEEFNDVVAMIQGDASLREDIEAITGQKIASKTPRELFDLYRTIQRTTEVQAAVVNYGRARRALRQTRAEMAEPVNMPEPTAQYVARVQTKLDEEKQKVKQLEEALKAARSRNVLQLPAANITRQAVGQ